ncbi:hypothetical protein ABXK61_09330 [Burkholderia sola]|uniref:hypothetical protein n=1 Tax=Burkholderia TaxID=32008 RepID=UPI001AE7ABE6|nr:hypothetical protein [Burkholderia sp. AcTa6-5]MBP0713513.1 hypothetical protein [Burkholderia sp. AcTa6-5]
MITEAKFNRLSIAVRDFEKCIEFAEEAKGHSQSSLAYEAIVFAAIVCYYRPFSPNERGPAEATSKLELGDFANLTAPETELHEKCKRLRNKAIAHSEYKYNPTRLDTSSGVIASMPFSLAQNEPNLAALSTLARKLAEECHHMRADYVRNRRNSAGLESVPGTDS